MNAETSTNYRLRSLEDSRDRFGKRIGNLEGRVIWLSVVASFATALLTMLAAHFIGKIL